MASLYDARMGEAKQKADLARLLRQQYQGQPAGQMVSGWYVPNTGNAVLGAMSNILGAYQEKQARDKMKGIEREKAQAFADALGQAGISAPSYMLKQAGTEEQQPAFTDRALAFLRGQDQPQATPAVSYKQNLAQNVTPEQRDAALMNLYGIDSTQAAPMIAHEQFKLQQQQAADLKREAIQAQREKALANRQSREEMARMADQTRRDMAAFTAGNRQQPTPYDIQIVNGVPIRFNKQTGQVDEMPAIAGGQSKLTPEQIKTQDANDALAILKQAAPLINQSTSSGIGAGIDYAAGLIGQSTKGADVASQLKVLGGALVAKMPKMSGPQSDKDVLLYKEMAGRIGDPTVPVSQKRAAMQSINELQARYAGVNPVDLNFEQQSSGWNIKEVK